MTSILELIQGVEYGIPFPSQPFQMTSRQKADDFGKYLNPMAMNPSLASSRGFHSTTVSIPSISFGLSELVKGPDYERLERFLIEFLKKSRSELPSINPHMSRSSVRVSSRLSAGNGSAKLISMWNHALCRHIQVIKTQVVVNNPEKGHAGALLEIIYLCTGLEDYHLGKHIALKIQ